MKEQLCFLNYQDKNITCYPSISECSESSKYKNLSFLYNIKIAALTFCL